VDDDYHVCEWPHCCHPESERMKHPVGDRGAAYFHAGLALYFIGGLGFHLISAWRHWKARERRP